MIVTKLQDKKILFLGTGFYDYEKAMIIRMKSLGAVVTYYDVITKGILFWILDHFQLLKNYKIGLYKKKLMQFIKSNTKTFDCIFVLDGYYITEVHLTFLKKNQKDAIFILYLWDAICRIEGIEFVLHFFDKIFSFDSEDVTRNGFIFRPLFFRPEIRNVKNKIRIYDVSFVGSGHSDRILLLKNIRDNLLKYNYKILFKISTGRKKILSLLFTRKLHVKDLSMFCWIKKNSYKKYCEILSISKCVIDIHHQNQDGLTMRTVEALASGCFLITTNENIKKYKDIPPSSYFILDRDGGNINNLNINNITRNNIDMSSYTLKRFIEDIFDF